jgi:eukaryotic-like serine/threonine-protein kinase
MCPGDDTLAVLTQDDDLPPLGEGELLAEKYRVERVLGVGGVGVVVAAAHVTLGQRVALKFLRKSAARDQASVERFLREARAVVRLKSQHAIRVQDVGTLETGEPYMVMELLEGCDFATLLEQRGRLPISEAVSYVLQACEALAEAHAAGIVHRDLKPENLFLTTGVDHLPLVKVLDFGLVKEMSSSAPDASGKSLTGALVMGTPGYMSPEQIKSTRDVDARADIWSVGVVLYELLSGHMPFAAESLPELIASIVRDPPRPLTQTAPEVSQGLSDVVARCLEKDPAKRFQKISKLAVALDEFVTPLSVAGAGARLGLVQPSDAPPPTPPIAWRPANYVVARAKDAATLSASTLDEIVVPATPSAARSPSEELPTGKSKVPVWAFAAGGVAVVAAALYVATRSTVATPSPAVSSTISSDPAISDAGPPSSLSVSAMSISTPVPNLSASASRSNEVPPSAPSKATSKGTSTPRGSRGGKDAGTNEGRLLETR